MRQNGIEITGELVSEHLLLIFGCEGETSGHSVDYIKAHIAGK